MEQKLEEEKSMVGRRGLAQARAQTTRDLGELEVELVADPGFAKRSVKVVVTFPETYR